MTLIAQFAGNAGRQRIRITKNCLGLQIRRIASALGVVKSGLTAGLPETISGEITNPARRRAELGDNIPLAMAALFGQYLRGFIPEFRQGDATTTEVNFWLNQSSAIELTSEDQFYIDFTPSGEATVSYEVYAPELPLVAGASSMFYNYEVTRMASDLRSKELHVLGSSALIIPNNPALIERVTTTINLDGGGQKEVDMTLRELLGQAQRANPLVAVSNAPNAPTYTAFTQDANYILITTNALSTVEIHNVLGAQYDYMLVRVNDRNALG